MHCRDVRRNKVGSFATHATTIQSAREARCTHATVSSTRNYILQHRLLDFSSLCLQLSTLSSSSPQSLRNTWRSGCGTTVHTATMQHRPSGWERRACRPTPATRVQKERWAWPNRVLTKTPSPRRHVGSSGLVIQAVTLAIIYSPCASHHHGTSGAPQRHVVTSKPCSRRTARAVPRFDNITSNMGPAAPIPHAGMATHSHHLGPMLPGHRPT